MGIRRKHPIRQIIMEDGQFRRKHHTHLVKCLEKAGMIGDDGDDEDADEREGSENENVNDNQEEAEETTEK